MIFSAALLPAILLWLYIWKQDPQPESTSWLVKAVLWGIGICIPVAMLEMGIEAILFCVEEQPASFFETIVNAFVVAALPEESFRWLIFFF